MHKKSRLIKKFRYGPFAGWLRRNTSKRRKKIAEVRKLYLKLGLVDAPCSLCKSDNFQLLSVADRYGFDIKKQVCLDCNLVQSNPRPSKEFHQEFYKNHYRKLYTGEDSSVDYASMESDFHTKGKIIIDVLKKAGVNNLKNFNIIEIGCSSGGILKYLEPFTNAVYGSDLDEEAIKYGQKILNLNIRVGEKPDFPSKEKNIFILSHVLEHVFDPLEFIISIKKMLKESDFLYIAVPGMNMVKLGNYKYDLRRYFHLAHVTDFTKETLLTLITTAGLKSHYIDENVEGVFQINREINVPNYTATADIKRNILEIVKSRKLYRKP